MKKIIYFFLMLVLHLGAVGVLIWSFLPLAQWYFGSKPLWGVDFYYTASIVNMLRENIIFPPQGWGYAWFTGWPLLSNYPLLHYYLILPFSQFFFLLDAIKIWMLLSLGLFFLGCYATFYTLSRNIALALILAASAIYSVGVYGTLMWGGSLPSHATQAFLPWVAFFIITYLKGKNFKHLLYASLLTGLAIWGHPQVVIAYIYPTASILLLFAFGAMGVLKRVKSWIIFVLISFIVGLPLYYSSIGETIKVLVVTDTHHTIASSTARITSQVARDIANFHLAQPLRIYKDTNSTTFILLLASILIFLLGFSVYRRKKQLTETLPFIILAAFSAGYVWIFAYGISIYHGGWYRLFWAVPFWVGTLTAVLWGVGQQAFEEKFADKKNFFKTILVVISSLMLGGGYILVSHFAQGIQDKIVMRSNSSSAFPDVLNLRTGDESYQRLKKEMVPDWLDPNQTNYRIYSGDQTVNIWWNALYKMPLARGYFDPPLSSQNKGYFFWLDAALSQDGSGKDQLVASFKYPADISFNNTLYLVDWYGIKYFEAGHAGPTAYAPLPKSLNQDNFIKNEHELDFNKEKYNKGNQTLHYYELKDEFVTPILSATNAPTLGIVASEIGYETIVRGLADMKIGPSQVIPIKLGQVIDKLNARDLNAMDALLLYGYKYDNKEQAFRLISDYVKKGKRIFLETGEEVKESADNGPLPQIFPIDKTYRKPIGEEWGFELIDKDLGRDVDFLKFDPPLFDDSPWKLSYPQQASDVRSNTAIILKNNEIPVMVSHKLESGEIIWSGMNLPYHVTRYHNKDEIRFLKNIIEKLLENSQNRGQPTYEAKFDTPQKREIKSQGAVGVLFKEQAYPGWEARASSGGQNNNVKIFKAGPSYPGFMYVRLGDGKIQKEVTATFLYRGSPLSWALFTVAVLISISIIEKRPVKFVWRKISRNTKVWWGKEDE